MKNFRLLFAMLIFTLGCSKEKTFGPWNLKDGQEVEVLVSHRYGAIGDQLTLLPQGKATESSISSFSERQPGYNYKVRVRMVAPETPPQDGSSYWLEFVKILSKEKYTGDESFEIDLIKSGGMIGTYISLWKKNDLFYYYPSKIILTAANAQIAEELEAVNDYNKEYATTHTSGQYSLIKWVSVKATVKHDPANFGMGYVVTKVVTTPR